MNKTIGIIGGDLRIIRLAEILAKEEFLVYTYALEKYSFKNENIIKCNNIQEVKNNCNSIVSGVPFSKDGKIANTPFSNAKIEIKELFKTIKNTKLFVGAISKEIKEDAKNNNIEIFDLLKEEKLTILNIIPTVEGALKVAIEETEFTLNGAKCLILGFGRIGKLLAKDLKSLGATVYVEARKQTDLAWIKAYGYNKIDLKELDEYLKCDFDIIFNTIPFVILNEERLKLIKGTKPLIIELASKPGGVDQNLANKFEIRVINAQGLPGKVAPLTSAINIYNILKERKEV